MLLRLRKNSSPTEVEAVFTVARALGYEPRILDRGGVLVELLPGGPSDVPRAAHRSRFEDQSAVETVLESSDAPELHEREAGREETRVEIGAAAFGAGAFSLVAGPCAVEDPDRLIEIARSVHAAGAVLLRGGAFKPRTSPWSFQGQGRSALAALAAAREATGLGIVTEVLDPRDVEAVAEVADMLQIGSRSMSNTVLLTECARSGRPVLLKRGLAATGREFLLAAECVLANGNENVVLCERGIRGFDNVTRNVLDVGMVAWLKLKTHLPVVVDPSHAAGRADLVLPLAKAGVAAGADGVIVEVHPEPAEVHSDGAQALSFDAFAELARGVRRLAQLEGKTPVLPPERIDAKEVMR